MLVAVVDDRVESNNGVYKLLNRNKYKYASGWSKIAEAADLEALKLSLDTDLTLTIGTAISESGTVYTFTQGTNVIGSINIAKELVVTSGEIKTVIKDGVPYPEALVGDKYLELKIANQETPIYIPCKDLVDVYTTESDAEEVQLSIDAHNKISARLVDSGISTAKLKDGCVTNAKLDVELAKQIKKANLVAVDGTIALTTVEDETGIRVKLAADPSNLITATADGLHAQINAGSGLLKTNKDTLAVALADTTNGLVAVDGKLSIALATQTAAGALSAADKLKLDTLDTQIHEAVQTALQEELEESLAEHTDTHHSWGVFEEN